MTQMRTTGTRPVLEPARALQHLLEKQHLAPGCAAPDVVTVADDLIGLHATASMSPYLSAFARMAPFRPEDLDRELYERRSLLRLKCMRGTVFVVSRELAPVLFGATRTATIAGDRRWLGVAREDYERWAPRVLEALAGTSAGVAELRRALGAPQGLAAVVSMLCDEGRLLRDRPSGSRRSSAFRYRRWEDLYPGIDLAAVPETEAIVQLVGRYVAAYGPATVRDVTWWSGLSVRAVRAAVAEMGEEVQLVRLAGDPRDWLVRCADLDQLRAAPAEPDVGVALLPVLDPLLMGYRDRDRLLDPSWRGFVYDPGGNATSTVLVDGRVSGVWDLVERPRPEVRVRLFDTRCAHREAVLERCAAIGAFWFGRPVPVVECASMAPLAEGRSAVHPLDGAVRARARAAEPG